MPAILAKLGQLVAGQMIGTNNKASFIVKSLRGVYITSATTIALLWYSSYRNERVKPGEISLPFPGLKKLKRAFPPDRPEKELQHLKPIGVTPSELGINPNTGNPNKGPTALVGPLALQKGIEKANQMSGRYPYKWGGGHAQIGVPSQGIPGGSIGTAGPPPGYDCSGAVSAVLGAIGVLKEPLTSGSLASFGAAGPGNFVTIYANAVHTFMKININGQWRWFGTGSDKHALRGGPAWGNHDPDLKAYAVRHPVGY